MIAIAVHGGAWAIPDAFVDAHRHGVHEALNRGWSILHHGGSAVDAVVEVVKCMEDDETFDAGRGAFINAGGEVELDASVMDGSTLRAGAVAAVQHIRNPILLARKIMDESEHILLTGMGALRFAREHAIPTCHPDDLIIDRELQRWREAQTTKKRSTRDMFKHGDTVGAVALDKAGNVASATSTGGTPNKYPGRVGDSPLIGSGTYADNEAGAVSTTGWGESIMKVVLAKTVIDAMNTNGRDPEKAAQASLDLLVRKVHGHGGIIALTPDGRIGVRYNTARMPHAFRNSGMKAPVVVA